MDSVSRDGSRAQLGQPNSAPAPEEPVGAAFKSYLRRLSGPGGGAIERHNYRVVQLDSVAMGVVAAATPLLGCDSLQWALKIAWPFASHNWAYVTPFKVNGGTMSRASSDVPFSS